ncbi:MAG: ABC transporter ATP-binding protein [Muribaculaceae bacterium]|nr:ABC transporter ATP-binding protein [Muribaculaceae bacterium]
MSIISVKDLVKTYNKGRTKAVDNLSFDVERGEIFGLIGPDGAGKTSIFRMLTTLILADSGTATIDGMDVVKDFKKIRQHIGYMPGQFSLYQDMTVEENLAFFATVFNTTIEENYHLVKDIYEQIKPFKDRRSGKLSGGMKQKLALCCALIHAPLVLFLDEPTTGVDPVSRKEFWEMLQKLKHDFKLTIIVSTPYMDEAVQCDRIALIQNGRFLTIDSPDGIIDKYRETLWAIRSNQMHRLLNDLRQTPGVLTASGFGETHHVTVDPSVLTQESLKNSLAALGHTEIEVTAIRPTIEDCFMDLQS